MQVSDVHFNKSDNDDILPGWTIMKLGEIFSITKKPHKLRYEDFDTIPFVPMDLIPYGCISFSNYTLKNIVDIPSGVYFEPGDVLIPKITPSFENGKQGILRSLPIPFGIASTEIIPLKEKIGISDRYFIFYYLLQKEIRSELAGKMEGSTGRQRLSKSVLLDLSIRAPPLSEQHAIAYVLFRIQKAIQIREKFIAATNELKKSLMQKLFTEGLHGEELKDTEIGRMPASWEIKTIRDVAGEIQYGLSKKGEKIGEYPILRMNCFVDGVIMFNNLQYVDVDKTVYDKFGLVDGDILFNRTNSLDLVGKTAVFHSNQKVLFASYLLRLKSDYSVLDPDFLSAYMNLESSQIRVKGLATRGVSQSNISANRLKEFKVSVPSIKVQKEIVEILSTIDYKLGSMNEKSVCLQELFKSMLNQLMIGKVRVKDLEVPADAFD
jgi:type I restriction enzyme S subunit